MDQEKKEKIRNLERMRDEAGIRRRAIENEMNGIIGKIERLRRADKKIAENKEQLKAVQKNNRRVIRNDEYDWEGERYKKYKKNGEAMLHDYFMYMVHVDEAHDEIHRRIAYYENKILEKQGLLGEIAAQLNSIGKEIETIFNW